MAQARKFTPLPGWSTGDALQELIAKHTAGGATDLSELERDLESWQNGEAGLGVGGVAACMVSRHPAARAQIAWTCPSGRR